MNVQKVWSAVWARTLSPTVRSEASATSMVEIR